MLLPFNYFSASFERKSSRFLAESIQQSARFAAAERFYFINQNITKKLMHH